jgi:DNA-binding MarR family transcriptional regulator
MAAREPARARHKLKAEPELAEVVEAAERFVLAIESLSMALMLKLDLTMPQLRVLLTIRRSRRAHGRQLASVLNVTPGAIVAICDHLEARGYVRRVTDGVDRRITWFEPTEEALGRLRATPTGKIARSRIKALIAGMSDTERQGFVKIAEAFADAISVTLESQPEARDDEFLRSE